MNETMLTWALSSKMPRESGGLSWASQGRSGNVKSGRSRVQTEAQEPPVQMR